MLDMWNQRYGASEYIYGTAPNAFFKEQLAGLEPGNLLLPCEGEGRNGVYAATLGWNVTAFDYSEAGRSKAITLAAQKGVELEYQISSVQDFRSGAKFDALALIYTHFSQSERQDLHQRLCSYLKPGATVILEAFNMEQLNYDSGGPRSEVMLYSTDLLREDFAEFEIVFLEDQMITLDEGPAHEGEASVVRMVARKPPLNTE